MGGNGRDRQEQSGNHYAALIIPAYNEESSIAGVLEVACRCSNLSRIIVVDDGSSDHTSEIADKFDRVEVLKQVNRGKAGAMEAGINATSEDLLLFLDADLKGLTPEHINDLIDPVANGECDMTMGLFYGPPHPSRWAHRVSPGLSGQRAVKREVFELLDGFGNLGYGIETAFTKLINRKQITMETVRMEGVTQLMKEEKRGFLDGARLRCRMFYEIVKTRFYSPHKKSDSPQQ